MRPDSCAADAGPPPPDASRPITSLHVCGELGLSRIDRLVFDSRGGRIAAVGDGSLAVVDSTQGDTLLQRDDAVAIGATPERVLVEHHDHIEVIEDGTSRVVSLPRRRRGGAFVLARDGSVAALELPRAADRVPLVALDTRTGAERSRVHLQFEPRALALSDDGSVLATLAGDGVQVHRTSDGAELGRFDAPDASLLESGPDGSFFVVAEGAPSTITVRAPDGRVLASLDAPVLVSELELARDGRRLVMRIHGSSRLAVFDVDASGGVLVPHPYIELPSPPVALAFGESGELACADDAGVVSIIDVATGETRTRLRLGLPESYDVATITPDRVLVGDAIVDLVRGRVERELEASAAVVAADGTLLVARGEHVVHERVDGTVLGELTFAAPVEALAAFGHDGEERVVVAHGSRLEVVGLDGTERLATAIAPDVVRITASRDGAFVALVRLGQASEIVDARADALVPRPLTVLNALTPSSQALSADGTTMAFVGSGDAVWVATAGTTAWPLLPRASGSALVVGATPWGFLVSERIVDPRAYPIETTTVQLPPLGFSLGADMLSAVALDEHRALILTEGRVHMLCDAAR